MPYRQRQISQWEFPPEGAFVHYVDVATSLSKARCSFVFFDLATREWVNEACSEDLKEKLRSGDLS